MEITTRKHKNNNTNRNVTTRSMSNLESEQNIAEETYGHKKAKTSQSSFTPLEHNKDSQENQENPTSTTTIPYTQADASMELDDETFHQRPTENDQQSHDVNPDIEAEPIDKQHISNQSTKGKNKDQQDSDDAESITIPILGNKPSEKKLYEVFFLRDSYPQKVSNSDIRTGVQNCFAAEYGFLGVRTVTPQFNETLFIIRFNSQETKDKYVNKVHPLLKLTLLEYTEESATNHISSIVKQRDNFIIKVVDVPYHYDPALVVKHVVNKTHVAVSSYTSFASKKNSNNRKNNNNNNRNRYRNSNTTTRADTPRYRTIIITFEKTSGPEYLFKEDIWSLKIENFYVRILPGNYLSPEYIKRTSNWFKITGIPLNADINDLDYICTHLKGKTLSFQATTRSSISKNAYIYAEENDVNKLNNKIRKHDLEGHTIYIFPNTNKKKNCTICGSIKHDLTNCDAEHILDANQRKIYKKKFLNKPRTQPKFEREFIQSYYHVSQSNQNKQTNNDRTKPMSSSRSVPRPPRSNRSIKFSNAGPSNNFNTTNENNRDYVDLLNRMKKAEQHIEILNNKITSLEESNVKLVQIQESNLNTINTLSLQLTKMSEHLALAESINVNTNEKLNHVITQIELLNKERESIPPRDSKYSRPSRTYKPYDKSHTGSQSSQSNITPTRNHSQLYTDNKYHNIPPPSENFETASYTTEETSFNDYNNPQSETITVNQRITPDDDIDINSKKDGSMFSNYVPSYFRST